MARRYLLEKVAFAIESAAEQVDILKKSQNQASATSVKTVGPDCRAQMVRYGVPIADGKDKNMPSWNKEFYNFLFCDNLQRERGRAVRRKSWEPGHYIEQDLEQLTEVKNGKRTKWNIGDHFMEISFERDWEMIKVK